jgi:protein-L-isoaspartate(D-aspartate) O-methyltransferase|tara:strand:+ start:8064 stop:8738 length:675 start_codon:yes stop_codon:yes gene_type:complete
VNNFSKKKGIGMTSSRTRERLIDRLREKGIRNNQVLERIRDVPRHFFIDEALSSRAYEDTALPIGFGQTISQPYVVALMTELLLDILDKDKKFNRVLEIGTGCGYQTAILSSFAKKVFSIERIKPLLHKSRDNLLKINIKNISFRLSDGYLGWRDKSPFQAIIVAAAPLKIPNDLLMQLDDGGRLVIPVGNNKDQDLVCITRQGNNFDKKTIGSVNFVPLIEGT